MKRAVRLIAVSTLSIVLAASVEAVAGAASTALITSLVTAAKPQALNPPYLGEMPSVDRVMQAMRTSDPRETALRQMGAFYQLIEIIKTLSGRREFRGFTPDEGRIIGEYQVAQYNVGQAADKAFPGPAGGSAKFSDQTPYRYGRWDPRFGMEGIQTFTTFLPPTLKAESDKIGGGDNARREARAQSDRNEPVNTSQPAPQQGAAVKPGSQAELRRCIASGRSQRVCFSEVLGNGMSQLTGINLKTASKPGLRVTGHYAGPGGFRIIFQPDSVTMVCKEVPVPRPYGVEVTETQGLAKIQNGSQQIVLTMRPDGKLSGAGPVRVAGQVPAGTRTEETMGLTPQTTTRERQLGPGEQRLNPNAKQNRPVYTVTEQATEWVYGPTGTHTVTNYVTKTADCNLGLLTPIGPTPLPPDIENPFGLLTTIFSGASTLMNGGSANDALNDMLNLDKAAPPGLRMSGRYAGKSGFGITFHPESATVACGDAELAHEYSVERTANQILLKIRDKTSPLSLQLKPDGSLFGEGMVQVNGRDIVGTTDDPKNPFVFTPKIGRCAVGSLIAGAPIITPPTASTGTAGVPSSATSIPPMANAV